MTEQLVPNVLTPVTPVSLYNALKAADPTLSRGALLVLLAQVALETGWRDCHCFNLGNVKWTPGCGRDFCTFTCTEVIGGRTVTIPAGAPGAQFRAYDSLAAGAVDYMSELRRQFSAGWDAVLSGNCRLFVQQLAAAHYFTAPEQQYENSVAALDAQLAKLIPGDPPLPAVAPLAQVAIEEAADADSLHDDRPPTDAA
jgi:hypothetical protein